MFILSILPLIIFVVIIFGIVVVLRVNATKQSISEASFQIAMSYDDLLRQSLLAVSIILAITSLYATAHSLGFDIAWYWFATIGGGIAMYYSYKQHSPINLIIGILIATLGLTFGGYQVATNNNVDRGLAYMAAFLLFTSLYGISISFFRAERAQRYYIIFNLMGVLGIGIVTFFLGSFGSREVWGYIANGNNVAIWSNWKTGLILIGLIGLLIFSYIKAIDYFKQNLYQLIISGIGVVSAILVLLLPNVSLLYDSSNVYSYSENNWAQKNLEILPHIISMNILFLVGVLWLLYTAYRLKEVWRLNLSILALFIFVLVRYFDWVERTELDRSLFFLSLGVIFLITGWGLERLRRNILASIDN